MVTLTQCSEGHVQITGEVSCTADECQADGNHGFHIHENSPTQTDDQTLDCAAAGGISYFCLVFTVITQN